MLKGRWVASIQEIPAQAWDGCRPDALEPHAYLWAVEASKVQGFDMAYVVVEEDGHVLATAPAFFTRYSLSTTLPKEAREQFEKFAKLIPGNLSLKLCALGSPCTEEAGLSLHPDLSDAQRASVADCLLETFVAMARSQNAGLWAVKDLQETDREFWLPRFEAKGFKGIAGMPIAELPLTFSDRETYLTRLSSGTRKDMRRKLKSKTQVTIVPLRSLRPHEERVRALYAATLARADMSFEELDFSFFEGVLERLGDRAVCFGYFKDDELLAVNLLVRSNDTLLDKYFLMDEKGRDQNLYFISWFVALDYALEQGLKRFVAGQAAYDNKIRLGCQMIRTDMIFKHRNGFINFCLQKIAPFFAADPTLKTPAP